MKRWSVGGLGEFENDIGPWVRFFDAEAAVEQERERVVRELERDGRTNAAAFVKAHSPEPKRLERLICKVGDDYLIINAINALIDAENERRTTCRQRPDPRSGRKGE